MSRIPYPGATVREQGFRRRHDVGHVCIQEYSSNQYRVAMFLPGICIALPGDAPKVEPEYHCWCESREHAEERLARLAEAAEQLGWARLG